MRRAQLSGITLLLLLVTGIPFAGCDQRDRPEEEEKRVERPDSIEKPDSSTSVFLPTLPKPQDEWNTALLIDTLRLEGNCLRAANHLVIWPYGFTVEEVAGEVQVKNENGRVVARVGEELNVGGGGSQELPPDLKWIADHGCDGPYWFAGPFPK